MEYNASFLIVEDDKQIRMFISSSLEMQKYKVFCAITGQEALNMFAARNPDVIILDLGLPDLDGLDIIRRIREYSQVPIIVVSARDQDTEKIEALDAGADDYLTKPFSIHELHARLRVILRRQETPAIDTAASCNSGDLVIDSNAHLVYLKGKEIHFTPFEFNILALLVKNPGRVMTHSKILQTVWGSYLESDAQTLRVFMANIRRKLGEDPANPKYIITEVGVGYRFAEE